MKFETLLFKNDQKILKTIKDYWYEEWSEKSMAKKINSLQNKASYDPLPLLFVAKYKGGIVGTAGLFSHDLLDDLSPWLGGVYTVKDFRNQGIATHLINKVINEAKNMGYQRIFLYTEKTGIFYRKLGWTFMDASRSPRGRDCDIYYLDI